MIRRTVSRMRTGFQRALGRLTGAEEGSVAVETALVTTVLLVMAVGALDFGLAFSRRMALSEAVRAGADYAVMAPPMGGDMAPVVAATRQAAPDGAGAETRAVDVALFCTCPGEAGRHDCIIGAGATPTCAAGTLRNVYVRVSATESHPLLVGLPGLPERVALGAETVRRIN
ncbi:TadE/TadG family type IV pilus assembly protein [Yunchengibacter salinarum]|uniref:TadE/TadG family type IV pilus assembly protein n=1 Tax=Yunchengibacter salinarum TaxID=3133399 RepID=UPI0035B64529